MNEGGGGEGKNWLLNAGNNYHDHGSNNSKRIYVFIYFFIILLTSPFSYFMTRRPHQIKLEFVKVFNHDSLEGRRREGRGRGNRVQNNSNLRFCARFFRVPPR